MGSPYLLTASVAYSTYSYAGSLDFEVHISILCDSTTFNTFTLTDMTFTIYESQDVQIIADPSDTVSVFTGIATYCG